MRGSSILTMAMLLIGPSALLHAEDDKSHSPELRKYVIDGMLKAIEKVQSAAVNISGEDISKKRSHSFHYSLKFDLAQQAEHVHADPGLNGPTGSWIRKREYLAQAAKGAGIVELLRPTDKPLAFVRAIDPRVFGFCIFADLKDGMSLETLKERVQMLQNSTECKVVKGEDGRYVIDYLIDAKSRNSEDDARVILVVNESRGFSIEKIELLTRYLSDATQPWVTASRTITEYTHQSDCWVPKTVSVTGYDDTAINLTLVWSRINESFPKQDFDVRSMDVLPNAQLLDLRETPSKPVLLGKVADGDRLIPTASRHLFRHIAIVVGSGAVVGLVLTLWLYRRRASRTSK